MSLTNDAHTAKRPRSHTVTPTTHDSRESAAKLLCPNFYTAAQPQPKQCTSHKPNSRMTHIFAGELILWHFVRFPVAGLAPLRWHILTYMRVFCVVCEFAGTRAREVIKYEFITLYVMAGRLRCDAKGVKSSKNYATLSAKCPRNWIMLQPTHAHTTHTYITRLDRRAEPRAE